MICTWMADVTPLFQEERYQEYYEIVPAFRKEKADRLRFQKDRALSVGAWCLWERMKEKFQLTEDTVFNLSHSGHYVLCSADLTSQRDNQVGCDLEEVKEEKHAVAKRFFCEEEYQMVLSGQISFYRLWVLKESFMKATRMGMKLDTRSFEFEFVNNKPMLKDKPDYYFKEYQIKGVPYYMAVCSNCNEFAEEVQWIDL